MSAFASAYRPLKPPGAFRARQHGSHTGKRKRGQISADDAAEEQASGHSSPEPEEIFSTTLHPVALTDPYHVAGHPRELPLPPSPFPHAAIKDPQRAKRDAQAELAHLNGPVHVSDLSEDKASSFKRRHVDNLTFILHRCMLKGDWARASRAWALLIRTEIAGRGIDVRRNSRWSIGAELLMRGRGDAVGNPKSEVTEDDATAPVPEDDADMPAFSLEGFKLARDYYERLILQYPHTARTARMFNATVVYPALFSIRIYEVQERSTRSKKALGNRNARRVSEDEEDGASTDSTDTITSQSMKQIVTDELTQALPIAKRMDELLSDPPYDSDAELLRLRGMVGRWLAHLHDQLAKYASKDAESSISDYDTIVGDFDIQHHTAKAEEARRVAETMFEKAGYTPT